MDEITINGKEVTEEQLEKTKEEVEHQPDVDLVEGTPNKFKKRIKG
jgi:hypothetical protein